MDKDKGIRVFSPQLSQLQCSLKSKLYSKCVLFKTKQKRSLKQFEQWNVFLVKFQSTQIHSQAFKKNRNNQKGTVKISTVVYFPHKTTSFFKNLRNWCSIVHGVNATLATSLQWLCTPPILPVTSTKGTESHLEAATSKSSQEMPKQRASKQP